MRVQTCAQNLCGTLNWFSLVSVLRGNHSKSNIAFGDSYLYYPRPLQHKYFQRDWIALSDMYRFQVIVCLFLFLNQQCSNSSCNITVVSVPAHIVAVPQGSPWIFFFLRHHFRQMRKICATLKKMEPVCAILKMKV